MSRMQRCARSFTRSAGRPARRRRRSSPICPTSPRATRCPRCWSRSTSRKIRGRASSSTQDVWIARSACGGCGSWAAPSPKRSRRRVSPPPWTISSAPCTRMAPASTASGVAPRSRSNTDPRVLKEFIRMSEEPKLEELDRLITMGKQKGFLTYDEVNDALPSSIVSLDQLDDIMMMFGSMDIEVVDSAKAGRMPAEVGRERAPAATNDDDDDGPAEPIDLTPGPVGRTEDPVRLYLREMGRVALLTREGEIALAKRIEEGKNQVTIAILSTDLALERFRELRELLRKGDISVKEVVDVNEEEFTEEKEAALVRTVVNAFGGVDRLLRERDALLDQVRKLKAKSGGKATAKKKPGKAVKEPAWKKLDTQAHQRQDKVLERLRTLHIGNQIIDREDSDPMRRGLVQRLRDLLDDIERAERVIRLWTNGRRPSPEEVQNLIYV